MPSPSEPDARPSKGTHPPVQHAQTSADGLRSGLVFKGLKQGGEKLALQFSVPFWYKVSRFRAGVV